MNGAFQTVVFFSIFENLVIVYLLVKSMVKDKERQKRKKNHRKSIGKIAFSKTLCRHMEELATNTEQIMLCFSVGCPEEKPRENRIHLLAKAQNELEELQAIYRISKKEVEAERKRLRKQDLKEAGGKH